MTVSDAAALANELHAFCAAAPHDYPGHNIELFERVESFLRTLIPSDSASDSVSDAALAGEPSRAAMEAAVDLEIQMACQSITTRGLALHLDKIAAALRTPIPAVSREEVAQACDRIANYPIEQMPIYLAQETLKQSAAMLRAPADYQRGYATGLADQIETQEYERNIAAQISPVKAVLVLAVEELNAALDKFWNTGDETSDGQIKRICAAQQKCKAALSLPAVAVSRGGVARTPGARWREDGKPDPHDSRYDCERAKLAHGAMSDDEIANAVFLNNNDIGILTAAKERIRWLSRQLHDRAAGDEPLDSKSARLAAQSVCDWADNNLSEFEAYSDETPVRAFEIFQAAKRLRDLFNGTLAIPAKAEAEVGVREALADLQSHREAWRIAGNSSPASVDNDDKLYWMHELQTFDRVFAALANLPAKTERAALEHARARFLCLAEDFEKAGDTVQWAMCSVDAERMGRALVPPLTGATHS